jgi:hypothetical protein
MLVYYVGIDLNLIKPIESDLRHSDFVQAEGLYSFLVDRYSRNLVWTLFRWKTAQHHNLFNFLELRINRRSLSCEAGATLAPPVIGS